MCAAAAAAATALAYYYLAPRFLSVSLSPFPRPSVPLTALRRLPRSSLCTANEQRARFRDAAKGATSSPTSPRGSYHPASHNRSGEKEGHFGRMHEKRTRKEERERRVGRGEGRRWRAWMQERDGRRDKIEREPA